MIFRQKLLLIFIVLQWWVCKVIILAKPHCRGQGSTRCFCRVLIAVWSSCPVHKCLSILLILSELLATLFFQHEIYHGNSHLKTSTSKRIMHAFLQIFFSLSWLSDVTYRDERVLESKNSVSYSIKHYSHRNSEDNNQLWMRMSFLSHYVSESLTINKKIKSGTSNSYSTNIFSWNNSKICK